MTIIVPIESKKKIDPKFWPFALFTQVNSTDRVLRLIRMNPCFKEKFYFIDIFLEKKNIIFFTLNFKFKLFTIIIITSTSTTHQNHNQTIIMIIIIISSQRKQQLLINQLINTNSITTTIIITKIDWLYLLIDQTKSLFYFVLGVTILVQNKHQFLKVFFTVCYDSNIDLLNQQLTNQKCIVIFTQLLMIKLASAMLILL